MLGTHRDWNDRYTGKTADTTNNVSKIYRYSYYRGKGSMYKIEFTIWTSDCGTRRHSLQYQTLRNWSLPILSDSTIQLHKTDAQRICNSWSKSTSQNFYEISIWRTFGFGFSIFGIVTVSTPSCTCAFTSSGFVFSGRRKRLKKLPWDRSTRCQVSPFCTSSFFLSPLISSVRPSTTCTLTSSFFSPGRSALKMCASGVSRQSICVLATAWVSFANCRDGVPSSTENPSKGSHTVPNGRGSKKLLPRPPKSERAMSNSDSQVQTKNLQGIMYQECQLLQHVD